MTTSPDQRSEQIRRAAAELFFNHGFEATTTRGIAEVLGIKSASIYYHYEDKQEILFEIIYSTMRELIDRVRVGAEQQALPDRKLATLIIHHVLMHAHRPKEAILGDTELRSLTGERRKVVQRLRDEYERLLTDILHEGREAGAFDLLDEKLTAYAILGAVHARRHVVRAPRAPVAAGGRPRLRRLRPAARRRRPDRAGRARLADVVGAGVLRGCPPQATALRALVPRQQPAGIARLPRSREARVGDAPVGCRGRVLRPAVTNAWARRPRPSRQQGTAASSRWQRRAVAGPATRAPRARRTNPIAARPARPLQMSTCLARRAPGSPPARPRR